MNYRKTVIAVVAGASLLGTFGVASASHRAEEPNYSPCRPTDPDETRVGYTDAGGPDDPQKNLPTIYAKGDPGTATGHIGICGGGGGDEPDVKFIEVGNDAEGPYVAHSDAPAGVPTEATPIPVGEGSVNVGDDYVEVDGTEDNQPSEDVHPWLDGYVSAGLTEHDGGPGVCMGGDGDHELFEDPNSASWKDCNEELLAGDPTEAIPAE